MCVWSCDEKRMRKKEKGKNEEDCTYTNAIARVRRKDGRVFSSVLLAIVLLLTRTRCAYCHHHQHHLSFFLTNILDLLSEKPNRKKEKN